ncbi:hypothetical protein ABZ312_11555 [Streptomyces sp. NPDC006207]
MKKFLLSLVAFWLTLFALGGLLALVKDGQVGAGILGLISAVAAARCWWLRFTWDQRAREPRLPDVDPGRPWQH